MKLEHFLLIIAAAALVGMMIGFGGAIIFPMAIFDAALYFALKRLKAWR